MVQWTLVGDVIDKSSVKSRHLPGASSNVTMTEKGVKSLDRFDIPYIYECG